MTAAAGLGSDVPVFLRPGRPPGAGGGERTCRRAEFRGQLPLLLLKPAFGVPTPWAYGGGRIRANCPASVTRPKNSPGASS